jgi:SecD/SecF fusion protein
MPGGPNTGGTMRRSFLTRTIICLIPTLIATGLVAWAYLKDPVHYSGFKLGIDLSGGTILVYEVDQELSKQQTRSAGPGAGGRATADASLAGALKRRIDPSDLRGVVIRPIGESRVEILMPYKAPEPGQEGAGGNDVEYVKGLIREVGSLEFRILANQTDDEDGLNAIKAYLERARDNPTGPEARDLEAAAKAGLPPPFPNPGPTDTPFLFKNEPVRYEWVELGKHRRAELGLSTKAAEGVRKRSANPLFAERLAAARTRNEVYVESNVNEEKNSRLSSVYYSRPSQNERNKKESEEKQVDYFVLTRVSDNNQLRVGGDITITANVEQGRTGSPVVGFRFNSRGGDHFYKVTSLNQVETPSGGGVAVQRYLAIILDGYLISSPMLNEPIRGSGVIEGKFERSEVERIVNLLRSGALPATLKPLPVSENTIGPTLGADTIKSGTLSVLLAFAAVLGFMLVYYRFAGVVATVALLANLLLTIGFMVAVNATFTLPGLAGLVLMLGMAVDANVLIYERVREERDRGMNLVTALRNGYDRALPTIIDTHLSSIFTAIVLYAVGNDQLKGFGVSLTVGLIISLFTSLYMTRLLFDFWQSRNWLTQLRMMRLFSRPNINFMKLRYPMFVATAVLTVIGVSLFLLRGQRALNVDFIGGTAYSGRLDRPMEIGELRKLLDEHRQKGRLNVARVEEIVDPTGKAKNTYRITFADGQDTSVALANAPKGATPEDRARDVQDRASILPDASVEQIFSGGNVGAASNLFTIRTTERERELVEASINRLFKDDQGADLLVKNEVTNVEPQPAGDYVLTFKDPVSKSAIRTLLEREFQARMGDQYAAADVFDVTELGEGTDGRYPQMKVRILKDANPGIQNLVAANQVEDVIRAVARDFAQRPRPERLETFDGTLASETRSRALYAILASWVAILLYLWFRFGSWTFGLAAVLCLIHDLCFTLGAIALCHYLHDTWFGQVFRLQDFKIDLPAVAALLTLVGYSVNDTIVVFDRIKEVRGKNPLLTAQTINDSVNQTLSRTILASLTVFLVVGVLYWFGGEGVHLFAFVMVIGVIVGTYSSIYIASPLLLMFGEGKARHHGHQPAAVEAAAQPA